MPSFYTLTGPITAPDTDQAVGAVLVARPETTNGILTFPGDRTTVGEARATVQSDGSLLSADGVTAGIKIPYGSDQGDVFWRFALRLEESTGPREHQLGVYPVNAPGRLDGLVRADVITVTATLVQTIADLIAQAGGGGGGGGGPVNADAVAPTATRLWLTPAERTKLGGVATGATQNASDAQLRDRETHTGEQPIESITGLQDALDQAGQTGGGGGSTADVRDLIQSAAVSASNATTYLPLEGLAVTNAATGQVWHGSLRVPFTAATAGGIRARLTGASSNLLPDPSLEQGIDAFPLLQPAAAGLSRSSALAAHHGTWYGVITANTTANHLLFSRTMPAAEAANFMADIRVRTGSGTNRVCRMDIEYRSSITEDDQDSSGSSLGFNLGTATQLTASSSWQRLETPAPTAAPAGTVGVRFRLAWLSAATGETLHVDSAQLVAGSTLPAFSAAGNGVNITDFAVTGDMRVGGSVVTLSGPSSVATFDGPASGEAMLEANLRVAVGGTGLTGRTLQLEVAQRTASGTATAVPGSGRAYALWSRSA